MNRLLSKVPRLLRWRYLRWVACSALIPALWACNSRRLAIPDPAPAVIDIRLFKQQVNHKLDILFMVDDSSSMQPLQTKMKMQLPTFMNALADEQTKQLPDLHVAVVSSSFGGGAWSNVNQCHSSFVDPDTLGDDQGRFLQGALGRQASPCTMLHPGAKFLINGDGSQTNPANFDGDIRDAFTCIASLGDKGCGFESQFESVYYALYKGNMPEDPDNGGFLRPDAVLAIVMVTNEDDCSVGGDSLLLNPAVNSVDDPGKTGLGALASYRCNEFGHLCDGAPPPHTAALNSSVTLNNCVSAENMGKTDDLVLYPSGPDMGKPDKTHGHLWPTVAEFTDYVKMYKNNPDDILVAAIAGPTVDGQGKSLYRVVGMTNSSANNEVDPFVDHSCTQKTSGDPEYADPAVRIKQWVDSFGVNNGVFYPICADDFSLAMGNIAKKIHAKLGASCVSTNIAADPKDPTKHNCQVTQKATDSTTGKVMVTKLEECNAGNANAPCYLLTPNSTQCTDANAKTLFKVCNEASCMTPPGSTESKDANISCSVE